MQDQAGQFGYESIDTEQRDWTEPDYIIPPPPPTPEVLPLVLHLYWLYPPKKEEEEEEGIEGGIEGLVTIKTQ